MISRRCFLQTAATALVLPSFSHSAEPDALDLGFSLYGMKTLPLETALRTCAEIGYTHVELALNPGYPSAPRGLDADARKALSRSLEALRLKLPCLMVNIGLTGDEKAHAAALEHIADAAALAHDLRPGAPPLLETVPGGKPSTWDEQKTLMAARLHEWAAVAEKTGIQIAIKAHVASAVNSPERLLWLLDEVKSRALVAAYDYSHFELQGIDMERSMEALIPRTRFIHVKDSEGVPQKFQFLLPGQGRTDYRRYFTLLRKFRYAGPVCVEVSGQIFNKPGYDPVEAARSSYAALSRAMQG
jgi:sugar phosphate isomerase/epimerase